MDRKFTHSTIYAPTIHVEGEARHVIRHRDGPTLCGALALGTQDAPRDWGRSALCPRCVQVWARETFGKAEW